MFHFILFPDHIADVSALEELTDNEAISISVPPTIPPASTSLRDYVDQSETLTKLVQLGSKTAFFMRMNEVIVVDLHHTKMHKCIIIIRMLSNTHNMHNCRC